MRSLFPTVESLFRLAGALRNCTQDIRACTTLLATGGLHALLSTLSHPHTEARVADEFLQVIAHSSMQTCVHAVAALANTITLVEWSRAELLRSGSLKQLLHLSTEAEGPLATYATAVVTQCTRVHAESV
jgi:hypothetical protein